MLRGFTHYCGKQRSNGAFIGWRETAKKRMVAKRRVIKAELRRRMHEPTASVGEWLKKVVMGYYQYNAVRETSTGCVSSGSAYVACGGWF
jgi:RNA-directed DNA polymerase